MADIRGCKVSEWVEGDQRWTRHAGPLILETWWSGHGGWPWQVGIDSGGNGRIITWLDRCFRICEETSTPDAAKAAADACALRLADEIRAALVPMTVATSKTERRIGRRRP